MFSYAGLGLIFIFSAEARQFDVQSSLSLSGPHRSLLATRSVSGKVTWADNGKPATSVTVKAYDNDLIGRELMGTATTQADGKFLVLAPICSFEAIILTFKI
jgi:hypothetical protein